jgi:hypothetical protein
MLRFIRLMELEFTDCPLVIADFQIFDVWGLHRHPALLIGMNFLRQFSKVSIDYGLKELRFDLARLSSVTNVQPSNPGVNSVPFARATLMSVLNGLAK